jgi:hypothetical protein
MQNISAGNSKPLQEQYPLKLRVIDDSDSDDSEDYTPAVTVQNFSSKGQMRRIVGRTNNRLHQVMSKFEYMVLILLDSNPNIIDIKTQFPHDLESSVELAWQLGINHPPQNSPKKTRLTTDFVVTVAGEPVIQIGVYAKYVEPLGEYRTIEKLQLESASLALLKIPLFVVTEKEINKLLIRSLDWILLANIESLEVELTPHYGLQLYKKLQLQPAANLASFLLQLDTENCVPEGSHLFRFKCLVQLDYFRFDLFKDVYKLDCADITFTPEALEL